MPTSILAATQLTKHFGPFCAVNGIDLAVTRGECVGLLGPNGAGKTTTIKMVYGAFSPSTGALTVFDLPMNGHRRDIKRRLGVLLQRDILEESLSAWDNLRIHGRHFGLHRSAIAERSTDLLALLQLGDRAHEPIFRFSGGMKRRLSIAKALFNQPELLLLDEPTTGLDPQTRHLLWEKIRALQSTGTTILLTTHYMHEAEALCGRVVVIDHGKIIEQGTPQALMTQHACANLEEVFLKLTGRELRD